MAKTMKSRKLLTLLLTLAMIVSLCAGMTVIAFATSGDVTLSLSADKTTAAVGDNVTFSILMEGTGSYNIVQLCAIWDETGFEYVDHERQTHVFTEAGFADSLYNESNEYRIAYYDESETMDIALPEGEFVLCSFTLKVLKEGELAVSFQQTSADFIEDTNYEAASITFGDPLTITGTSGGGSSGITPVIGDGTGTTEGGVTTITAGTGASAPEVTVTAPASGWVAGENTFTVASADDVACVVMVKNAEGEYTRLTATGTESHSFTATLAATDTIVIAVKGDANGDGAVGTDEAMLIARACLSDGHAAYQAAGAQNQCAFGTISTDDAMLIARVCLSGSHGAYQALTW